MKIGVVSDTHGFFDSRLLQLLAGVDVILHGGDVGSLPVLDELRQIASVYAVQGNVDPAAWGLPPTLTRRFDGVQIEVRHILPAPQAQLENWAGNSAASKARPARQEAFLKNFDPATRVIIFGHSHKPCLVVLGGRMFLNPGSAGRKRFSLPRCCAFLEILPGSIMATVKPLEGYNKTLLLDAQLDFDTSRSR